MDNYPFLIKRVNSILLKFEFHMTTSAYKYMVYFCNGNNAYYFKLNALNFIL